MSDVLTRVREKFPAYRDVPDDKLTLALGDKYPVYLEQDAQFKTDYSALAEKAFNEGEKRLESSAFAGIAQAAQAEADAGKELASTVAEQASKPLVKLPLEPFIPPIAAALAPDSTAAKVALGVAEFSKGATESLTAPLTAVAAVPGVGPAVFSALGVKGVLDAKKEMENAAAKGDITGVVKATGNLALSAGMVAAPLSHMALKETEAKVPLKEEPPLLKEAAKVEPPKIEPQKEGVPNASSQPETATVHGDVLEPAVPQESQGQVPADGRSKGVRPVGEAAHEEVRGEAVPASEQGTEPVLAPSSQGIGIKASMPSISKAFDTGTGQLSRLREGFVNAWKTMPEKADISSAFDAITDQAGPASRKTVNHLKLEAGRDIVDNKLASEALTPVVESGGDINKMAADAAKVIGSPKASQRFKDIYSYALSHFNALAKVVPAFRDAHDALITQEHAHGFNTEERANYIKHVWEFGKGPMVLDETGGSTGANVSTAFRKERVVPTYADGIAAGMEPKTFNAFDLAESRIKNSHMLVNKRLWVESLSSIKDPTTGGPIVAALKPNGSPPLGYQYIEPMPGVRLAASDAFAPILKNLTDSSKVPQILVKGEEFIKHNKLAFDIYHAALITQRKIASDLGHVRSPLETPHRKGLAVLEWSPQDVSEALRQKYIDKAQAAYINANYVVVDELLKAGLPVGRFGDAIYRELTMPGLRGMNKWIFDSLSRGAIVQIALENLKRNEALHPAMPRPDVLQLTARETSEWLGNLQTTGFFKNRTMQDLSNVMLLAPRWITALARSEGRGYLQLARAPLDLARGKPIGNAASQLGAGVAGMFAANQLINMATTGHPTWENPEGHKLDAFVPHYLPGAKSEGFWVSPFPIFGHYTADFAKYIYEGKSPREAAAQIAQNKLSPYAKAAESLIFSVDEFNQKAKGKELASALFRELAPVPLPLIGLVAKIPGVEKAYQDLTSEQIERQTYSLVGQRPETARTPQQERFIEKRKLQDQADYIAQQAKKKQGAEKLKYIEAEINAANPKTRHELRMRVKRTGAMRH